LLSDFHIILRQASFFIYEGRSERGEGDERRSGRAGCSGRFGGAEGADIHHDELGMHLFSCNVALRLFLCIVCVFEKCCLNMNAD
jgi:hypothetical protein